MSTEKLRREKFSLVQSFENRAAFLCRRTVTLHRERIDPSVEAVDRFDRLCIVLFTAALFDRTAVLSVDLFLICRRTRRADSGESVMAGEGDKRPSVLRNRK